VKRVHVRVVTCTADPPAQLDVVTGQLGEHRGLHLRIGPVLSDLLGRQAPCPAATLASTGNSVASAVAVDRATPSFVGELAEAVRTRNAHAAIEEANPVPFSVSGDGCGVGVERGLEGGNPRQNTRINTDSLSRHDDVLALLLPPVIARPNDR
jgi:hypothetical protein